MAETKPPKVFISYAWEDDIKTWVLEFATRLRLDGINAILDQWETVPGDQLTQFMEKSVRESDFVVFICTPTYKKKSDRRKGGVGYEGSIITGEVFAINNHRKFIPALRKGKWASASPSWATSKLFVDFRGDPYSETSYQQLLNTLFGKSPTAPPVRDDSLREKVELELAKKTARELAEREATKKAEREKVEREKLEREASEKAAREEAEQEAAEKAAREKLKHNAAENAAREKAGHETAQRVALEKAERLIVRKAAITKLLSKATPALVIITVIGIIIGLFWIGSGAMLKTNPPKPSETLILTKVSTPTAYAGSLLFEISDAKNVPMVLVPEGEFVMGGTLYKDEEPIHSINLPAYYIDKYEVTNAQYKLCVDDGTCDEPISTAKYSNQIYAYHPVVYVSWGMARVYCGKWRGARLPSEAEWEKAARGPNERIFPWDDRIITAYANYANYNSNDTKPVAYFSDLKGASFYGAYNMAGNVWEWASSLYKPYPYGENDGREDLSAFGMRVLRGGSWNSTLARDLYTFYRYKLDQTSTRDDVGFRCTKDVP